ncbi:hypothetical protein ACLMJK_007662 [Lecanora helva]
MDFPSDVKTNVYQIHDVNEIHWAAYSRRQDSLEKSRDTVSDTEGGDPICSIEIIVRRIRDQGTHAHVDERFPGLVWVFCLSEAGNASTHQELVSNDFRSVLSGCTNVAEIASASASKQETTLPGPPITTHLTQQSTTTPGIPNVQTIHENATTTTPSLGITNGASSADDSEHGLPITYQNCMLAFSQSILHVLLKGHHLLQVGPSMGVDARTLSGNSFEFFANDSPKTNSTILSCTVQWLSSGTLLFYLSETSQTKLCTLSHSLFDNYDPVAIEIGEPIILSPSGVICQFHGIADCSRTHSQSRHQKKLKSRISTWLVRNCCPMPQDIHWVYVLIAKGQSKARTVTIWPAHLCLRMDDSDPEESQTAFDFLGHLEEYGDVLSRAQTWFLGKDARADALENNRLESPAEAERAKKARDNEEANNASNLSSQNNQATPRDVSGIYPTPPDGLPAALNELSTTNDQQPSSNHDEVTIDSGKQKQYDTPANDVLFEEMDIDMMFTTNSLTEDDFNFFDDTTANLAHIPLPDADQIGVDEMAKHPDSNVPPSKHSSPMALQGSAADSVQDAKNPVSSPARTPSHEPYSLLKNSDSPILTNKQKESTSEIAVFSDSNISTLLPDLPDTIYDKPTSFNAVPFPDSAFDDKYTSQGRYGFAMDNGLSDLDLEENTSQNPLINAIPRVEGSADLTLEDGRLPLRIGTQDTNYGEIDDTEETFSMTSGDSMREDSGEVSEDDCQQLPRKRKRESSSELGDQVKPLSPVAPADIFERSRLEMTTFLEALFVPNYEQRADAFLKAKSKRGNPSIAVESEGESFYVQVAQMVADQAISSISGLRSSFPHNTVPRTTDLYRRVECAIKDWSANSGKPSEQCTLKSFIELDNHESSSQNPKFQKRPHSTRSSPAITKLGNPHTCVQRSGAAIDIAAPALKFWEELSLAPYHGSKDVAGVCIYPKEHNVAYEVSVFLKMTASAYQSCKLGMHHVGTDCHATIDMKCNSSSDTLFKMKQEYKALGSKLARWDCEGANIIVYLVNPFNDESYLPTLCMGFLMLSNCYAQMVKETARLAPPKDLVLQIVPAALIYSTTNITLPSPNDYRRLAFEVYDRCGPSVGNGQAHRLPYISAPSTRLAKALPKTIDFKLTPENPALSLTSDNCVHIAYAWTPEEDWLTAHWSDNLGILSWTACYCFGVGKDGLWQAFTEVANEIWETTLGMLQPRNGPWRLLLSKDGLVLKRELDAWKSAVANPIKPSTKLSVLFDFLNVESNPSLDFTPSIVDFGSLDTARASLETPENTPLANLPSPDIPGLGSTPGGPTQTSTPPSNPAFGDHDVEARLVDVTDDTWGVVINRSMDNQILPSEYCPGLASGYLVKRAGPRDEDGLLRIQVNVIHGQKPYRPLLKAVLGMYRNLGLLARVRGLVDPVISLEPYHIAAVRKAHRMINTTMPCGGE